MNTLSNRLIFAWLCLVLSACNGPAPNGGQTKGGGFDTGRLKRQIDSVVYNAAVQYHEDCGDLPSASLYLKTYLDLSRSLRRDESIAQSESARAAYEASKRENAQRQQTNLAQRETHRLQNLSFALVVNSAALILLVFFIIRQSKLRRRLEAEQLRNRLSRDLHDDIGSTLSSINILSRTAQRNLSASGDEKTKASLEKMSERSQRLLDSMSDIIWNIQTGNDTLEELLSRMREDATGILEAKGIACTFDFPVQAQIKLGIDTKTNLYLIFKEAVNNLAKYSGCSEARISLVLRDGHIVMEVGDNGRGFDRAELQHEGGLMNMQHRAAEMKGSLFVTSGKGNGTRITLHAPCNKLSCRSFVPWSCFGWLAIYIALNTSYSNANESYCCRAIARLNTIPLLWIPTDSFGMIRSPEFFRYIC